MTTDLVPAERKPLDLALLKAIGFDRLSPEQQKLGLAIAERYNLDPLLKQLVLIEGRVYITRDGLLHIAHRSGQLDGIVLEREPELDGEYWRATVAVYRKDMSHPFRYAGRYPAKGGNAKFAPEMSVKVAEVMSLRRAFDVAAPSAEERWDVDAEVEPPAARPTLAAVVAEKAAAVAPEVLAEPMPVEESAAVAPGMTQAAFKDFLRSNRIAGPYAVDVARQHWPDTDMADLSEAELAELAALLLDGSAG